MTTASACSKPTRRVPTGQGWAALRQIVYAMTKGALDVFSVSTTTTASSFAGSVVLALRLTRWLEPGVRANTRPASER
jgi:hypothetical protein